MMKIIIRFFLIFINITIFSCAEENDIFEEKFQEKTTVETGLTLDYINQELVASNEPSSCLKFKYPITLSTNTNNEVIIESELGLKDFSILFDAKFYVTGIKFPVTINDKEVNSTRAFNNQMDLCKIATFREVLGQKIGKCFNFEYPLSLFDSDGQIQTVKSLEQYYHFLENQGNDNELLIQYPITVQSGKEKIKLSTNFDFYQLINSCSKNCNKYTISTTLQDLQNDSIFEIKTEDSNEIESIQWFVGDSLLAGETKVKFCVRFLTAGNYNVCAKVKFINCLEVSEVCETIGITEEQVSSVCNKIHLSWNFTQTQGLYDFFIDDDEFLNIFANSEFEWRINNEIQPNVSSPFASFQFIELGEFIVSVTLIDSNCPDKPIAYAVININSKRVGRVP